MEKFSRSIFFLFSIDSVFQLGILHFIFLFAPWMCSSVVVYKLVRIFIKKFFASSSACFFTLSRNSKKNGDGNKKLNGKYNGAGQRRHTSIMCEHSRNNWHEVCMQHIPWCDFLHRWLSCSTSVAVINRRITRSNENWWNCIVILFLPRHFDFSEFLDSNHTIRTLIFITLAHLLNSIILFVCIIFLKILFFSMLIYWQNFKLCVIINLDLNRFFF